MAKKVDAPPIGPATLSSGRKAVTANPLGTPIKTKGRTITLPPWWGPAGVVVHPGDQRGGFGELVHLDGWVPICYGEVRIGGDDLLGALPDFGYTSTTQTFHLVWCDGEIDAIVAVRMNGNIQTAYVSSWDGVHGTAITNHRGAPGDTSAAEGWAAPTWDQNAWSIPVNPAYTKIVYTGFFGSGYINPWWYYANPSQAAMSFQADVRGRRIYDPRLDSTNGGTGSQRYTDSTTWAYSNNPALIVRDLWTFYGHVPNSMIDDASIIVAADACDDSGFVCNIAFTKQQTLEACVAEVLQTCAGYRVESEGKYGLWLDVVNDADPVLYLDEEAGSISGLSYEWLPASERPTYVVVKFANAAAAYKEDTISSPREKPDGVTVPLREQVFNIRGCTTAAQAAILADYLFGSYGKTLRIHGTIGFEGVALSRGMKVQVTTLSGVDAEFLVEQISGTGEGFFPAVLKPYDEVVYTTDPTIPPPPEPPAPPDPNDPPPDLEDLVEADVQAVSMDTDGSTKTIVDFAGFRYSLPDWPFLFQIVARAISTWTEGDRDSATWESMAANEFVIPLNGNLPAPGGGLLAAKLEGFQVGEEIIEYNALNEVVSDVVSRPFSRIIVRAQSGVGNLSTGITLDGAAVSSGGGVLPGGKPAIATMIEIRAAPLPALADAGAARIVLDEADQVLKASISGGPFLPLGGSGDLGALQYLDLVDQDVGGGGIQKNWSGLVFGDSKLVAVGTGLRSGVWKSGAIVSTDALAWTETEDVEANSWYDVVYGAGLFVAVSWGGTHRVMTSPDGATWTPRSSADDSKSWIAIAFDGTTFVAIATGSSKAMTSTNGTTWTLRDMGVAEQWRGLVWGEGLFVAIATGTTGTRVMTSPDGVTWTARSCGTPADVPGAIAYGGGMFMIFPSSTGSYTFYSADGLTWTKSATPLGPGIEWKAATYGDGHFLAVGLTSSRIAAQVTTSDGESFAYTNPQINGSGEHDLTAVLWVTSLSLWVAVGQWTSFDSAHPRIATSPDHSAWTERTLEGAALDVAPAGTLRIVSANDGEINTSFGGSPFAPLSVAPARLTSIGADPTITGTIDGANATFTTSSAAGSVFLVIVDGLPDVDATWSSTTLTTSVAPRQSVVAFSWG